jgi:hypothetical protein
MKTRETREIRETITLTKHNGKTTCQVKAGKDQAEIVARLVSLGWTVSTEV